MPPRTRKSHRHHEPIHPLKGSDTPYIRGFQKLINDKLALATILNENVESIQLGDINDYAKMANYSQYMDNMFPTPVKITDVLWQATLTNGSVVVRCTNHNRNCDFGVGTSRYVVGGFLKTNVHADHCLDKEELQCKMDEMKHVPQFSIDRVNPQRGNNTNRMEDCTYESFIKGFLLNTNAQRAMCERFYQLCPRSVLEQIEHFINRIEYHHSPIDTESLQTSVEEYRPFDSIDLGEHYSLPGDYTHTIIKIKKFDVKPHSESRYKELDAIEDIIEQ